MNGILHQSLAATYPLLHSFRSIGDIFSFGQTGRIRILLYHDVAPKDLNLLFNQLQWLSRNWTFICPNKFSEIIKNKEPITKNYLLLTFDDGFASNRLVAEKVLKPLQIIAIFFIISDFASIQNLFDAKTYISEYIYPSYRAKDIPDHWYNMCWKDLRFLIEEGHIIGGHTRTHKRLIKSESTQSIVDQIVGGANILEDKLGVKVDHFAFPFGNFSSFTHDAMQIAMKRFNYVFTGMRGNNFSSTSQFVLRRDSIRTDYSMPLLGAFLDGGADILYRKKLSVMKNWTKSI